MSDTQTPVDSAAESVATSTAVAPPNPAGDTQGSTPAPADTAAPAQAEQQGETPEQKQSRREARAFATQRRENRELHQQIGRLQAMIEGLRPQSPPAEDGQPQERATRSPAEQAAERRDAMAARAVIERLEDAGEEIEGFDKVMRTITGNFPMTTVMRDYLGVSDRPAEMAKWLAENEEEAGRIALLSDAVAVRALERAEAKLPAKAAPARTTKAPPPNPTVGGRSTANFDPEKASMTDYADHWHQRQAKRNAR